jgi:hypothetical protein
VERRMVMYMVGLHTISPVVISVLNFALAF